MWIRIPKPDPGALNEGNAEFNQYKSLFFSKEIKTVRIRFYVVVEECKTLVCPLVQYSFDDVYDFLPGIFNKYGLIKWFGIFNTNTYKHVPENCY